MIGKFYRLAWLYFYRRGSFWSLHAFGYTLSVDRALGCWDFCTDTGTENKYLMGNTKSKKI